MAGGRMNANESVRGRIERFQRRHFTPPHNSGLNQCHCGVHGPVSPKKGKRTANSGLFIRGSSRPSGPPIGGMGSNGDIQARIVNASLDAAICCQAGFVLGRLRSRCCLAASG